MSKFIEESKARFRNNFCATHHKPKCDCQNQQVTFLEQELKAQLEEIKQRVEGMKKKTESKIGCTVCDEFFDLCKCLSYNKALDQIIKTL